MSVINQVLNQLEQRGAHTAPEQTMVRAVPQVKRRSVMPLLILGLVLAIGVAMWQWMQPRKPHVPAVSEVRYQSARMAVAPASTPAVPAEEQQEGPLVAEALSPASRLSLELNSVPLPSSLRESKGSVAKNKVEEFAAKPVREPSVPPPAQIAGQDTKVVAQPTSGELPMKQVSPAQHADAEFRKAVVLMQQGRIADALAGYETVLHLDAGHDAARQALVALLLEGKRGAEAERALRDGLGVKPGHTGFAMLLARLQVERGAVEQATETLEKTLPYADRQADYQAFIAALLQRQNLHKEAIAHYQIALQLAPDNGIWLMGYGISLQAVQRNEDAKNAFHRALESKTLTPELQVFVQQKIKEL